MTSNAIASFQWTDAGGTVFQFNDQTRWVMLAPDGFGAPETNLVLRHTPQGHGASYVYTQLKERKCALNFHVRANDIPTMEANRAALRSAFSMFQGPGVLQVTQANGSIFSLACAVAGGLRFDAANKRGMNWREQIPFLAADPTWYNPLAATATLTNVTSGSVTATNNGDWETFPVLTFTPSTASTVTQFTVTNTFNTRSGGALVSTVKTFKYTGSIATGTTLTVDMAYANPLVYTGVAPGVNQWGNVDSTTTMWSLYPGANTIALTTDGSHAGTLTVTWKHRYSGV